MVTVSQRAQRNPRLPLPAYCLSLTERKSYHLYPRIRVPLRQHERVRKHEETDDRGTIPVAPGLIAGGLFKRGNADCYATKSSRHATPVARKNLAGRSLRFDHRRLFFEFFQGEFRLEAAPAAGLVHTSRADDNQFPGG